jgi:hypothetical protein
MGDTISLETTDGRALAEALAEELDDPDVAGSLPPEVWFEAEERSVTVSPGTWVTLSAERRGPGDCRPKRGIGTLCFAGSACDSSSQPLERPCWRSDYFRALAEDLSGVQAGLSGGDVVRVVIRAGVRAKLGNGVGRGASPSASRIRRTCQDITEGAMRNRTMSSRRTRPAP